MALRRNVLIFHSGALGDFVLTWPLAVALGRLFPQSRIFYVTHGQKGALAERVLRVESADVEGGWHHLYAEASAAALPERATKLLTGAHTIVSFSRASASDAWVRNVARIAPEAKLILLDPTPPADTRLHFSAWIEQQLVNHPIIGSAYGQLLRSVKDRGIVARPSARSNDVVLHPGSGSPDKCWPIDRYLELGRRLRKAGVGVRITLGDVERESPGVFDQKKLSEAGEVVKCDTLLQLHDQLSSARALVTNDTGPGHLGAMIGVPTLSLFGPTDPQIWSPLGPSLQIMRSQPLGSLEVNKVFDAVMSFKPTAPEPGPPVDPDLSE